MLSLTEKILHPRRLERQGRLLGPSSAPAAPRPGSLSGTQATAAHRRPSRQEATEGSGEMDRSGQEEDWGCGCLGSSSHKIKSQAAALTPIEPQQPYLLSGPQLWS